MRRASRPPRRHDIASADCLSDGTALHPTKCSTPISDCSWYEELSLPKTTSGNIHGAVRRGSAERRASQALDRLMARRILPQITMSSVFIVIYGIDRKHPPHM